MNDEPTNTDPLHPEEADPFDLPAITPASTPTDSDPATAGLFTTPCPAVGPADTAGADPAADSGSYGPVGVGLGGPPPPPPAPPVRRLVRDPYSRLGGVSSGIAHYYGLDVSLVRVVTLLLALTTGVGLLAYLLAWLIIPRADHWPPAGPPRPLRSLSNRDLGIGLAAIGLLFALAIGGGGAGGFLVPLVLVGGGVWLLMQPPAPVQALASGYAPAPPAPVGGGSGGSGGFGDTPPPPYGYSYGPAPAPQGAPVPPRSRKRRFAVISVVVLGLLTLLAIPLLAIGAFFVAVESGEVDMNFDGPSVTYRPGSADELPLVINEDDGEYIIDLTALDPADFNGADGPGLIDARVDFGRIEVIVPEDLDVTVDASNTVGDVEVFGRSDDGFSNDVTEVADDADLTLRLDAGAGEIVVRRG